MASLAHSHFDRCDLLWRRVIRDGACKGLATIRPEGRNAYRRLPHSLCIVSAYGPSQTTSRVSLIPPAAPPLRNSMRARRCTELAADTAGPNLKLTDLAGQRTRCERHDRDQSDR